MPRKLANWLKTFDEWTLPRSEAPEAMIHWSGIFALASILKRKVRFPRYYLGSYDIFPSLYVVYVAKPGVARKSTTVGYAQQLLRDISKLTNGENINFAPDVTSASKLLHAMSESSDGSLTIVANEFSSLVQATPEAMYETLTDLFDNKPTHSSGTWSHGDKVIENPVVNLIAATTPAWVAEQPPGYFLGGGFASRIIFVFEERRRRNKLYYDDLDHKALNLLEKELINDLVHISGIKGEFSHDNKHTRDYIEAWYQKHADKEASETNLEGYLERKHIHAHKIAMILSVAERDDRKITRKHWDEAIRLLDEVEKKLPRALASVGKNPLGPQMDSVLDFIEANGTVGLDRIARRFYRDLTLDQIKSILAFIQAQGKVTVKGTQMNPKYTIK